MKLAGPGTRLLPAHSQWAPAAGRFLGRDWSKDPEGACERLRGGGGRARGEVQRAAVGTEGERREHGQISVKIQERKVRLGDGMGRDGGSAHKLT